MVRRGDGDIRGLGEGHPERRSMGFLLTHLKAKLAICQQRTPPTAADSPFCWGGAEHFMLNEKTSHHVVCFACFMLASCWRLSLLVVVLG
jgi:hypothetical protein